ncbi:MAG: GNAT family N-acetyltransferase [Bacteroidetes bacterium]|jgi:GNAT superfamily N-acetyltransferase|nr:GNAT family N-acetyltransferase [Bacteroidota bacterium]
MNVVIREGFKNDMPAVLELIKELAAFEREPDAVVVTVEDLINDGFGKNPLFKTFIAEYQGEIVGMALFYNRYSTWKGKTIHLEDLIVKEDKRQLGIGKALYDAVLKYALNENVRRVEWVVLDWNKPAIDFYKKSGATILETWDTVQMNEENLINYVKSLS